MASIYRSKDLPNSKLSEKTIAELAGVNPTIDLKFDSLNALSIVNFSRNSIASYFDADGYLKISPRNTPRIDFNPLTKELNGLFIEPTRANLLTHTENFDDSVWIKSSSSVIANAGVAPDGSYTAAKLIENLTTDNHYLNRTNVSVISGRTYTFSIFVKSKERTFCQLFFQSVGFSASNRRAVFNLENGEFIAESEVRAKAVKLNNGWWRLSITASSNATSSASGGGVTLASSLTIEDSYAGNGKSGLYIWGAQLEESAWVTSYIPSEQTWTEQTGTGGTAISSYFDSAGLLRKTNASSARFSTNPSPDKFSLSPKLLLEPEKTNLLLYSEQFDNVAWLKTAGITVTSNSFTAPDGTVTADTIAKNTTTYQAVNQIFTGTIGTIYTFSVFIKAVTNTSNAAIAITGDNNVTYDAILNVNLATKTITDAGSLNLIEADIQELSNGWFKIWCSAKLSVNTLPKATLFVGNVTSTVSESIYAWGAQLEENASPTSYIQTVASTVKRYADIYTSSAITRIYDSAKISGSDFTNFYNFDEGSVCFEGQDFAVEGDPGGTRRFFWIGDSVARSNNSIICGMSGDQASFGIITNTINFTTINSINTALKRTVYSSNDSSNVFVSSKMQKFAISFSSSKLLRTIDGVFSEEYIPTTGTVPLPKHVTTLYLSDAIDGSVNITGYLKRLTYFSKQLSREVLNNITSKNVSLDEPGATKYRQAGVALLEDTKKLSEKTLTEITSVEPTLDLQFDSTAALSTVTFNRSSTGTYFDKDGVLKIAQVNQPRIEYDPATKNLLGLSIEEDRSNLLEATENIENSTYWVSSNSTIAYNVEVAPDGTRTANKIIENTNNSTHDSRNACTGSAVEHTLSIYAKAGERTKIRIYGYAFGNWSVFPDGIFDLITGTVVQSAGTRTATIQNVGNGWYRCSVYGTPNGVVTVGLGINMVDSANNVSYTGDGKSGIYIWGAQLEAGSFPTSYVPSAQTFNGRSLFTNIAYASISYAVNGQTTVANAVSFKPDGTKMYVADFTSENIFQYSLSTAWNVSTASYDSVSFIGAVTGSPYGFSFNNDGTKAYRCIANGASSSVQEYTLSSAYNLSTMTVAATSFSLNASITLPSCLTFSNDGSYLFVADRTTDKIYRYVLSTPWSLASVVFSTELSTSSDESNVYGIQFDSTGKTMIITGDGDNIIVYTLQSQWDVSTAKKVLTIPFTNDTFTSGCYLKPDNSALYVIGYGTTDTVYQYNTSLATGEASYYNSAGTLVKTSDLALARNTYNPSPDRLYLPPKLLLESQATNLVTYSEDLIQSDWNKTDVTISANLITAPDGTTTADKIIESAINAAHYIYNPNPVILDGIYTLSGFFKKSEREWVQLTAQSTAFSSTCVINVNLATGQVGYVASGVLGYGVQQLRDGWYRIWLSAKAIATDNNGGFVIACLESNINSRLPAYLGDITKGLYAWGLQLEGGTGTAAAYAPSSYIPTTTAAVTRSADFYTSTAQTRSRDEASIVGTNFSDWYRFDEGTIYVEGKSSGTTSGTVGSGGSLFYLGDFSVVNQMYISLWPNNFGGNGVVGGANVFAGASREVAIPRDFPYIANTMEKHAMAFKRNDFAWSYQGLPTKIDTSGELPIIDRIHIGSLYVLNNRILNGHIKRLTFFPARLSNAVLQEMTAKKVSLDSSTPTKYKSGYLQINSSTRVAQNLASSKITFSSPGMMIFSVDTGTAGMILACDYTSTAISAIIDPSAQFLSSDSGVGIYVFKSANSNTITIKNRTGSAKTIKISPIANSILTETYWE